MALKIIDTCINCGVCEPECPNKSIYGAGTEWELFEKTHEPLSNDFYYIVPEKCTECVGFHDEPQCVAVCPVDACVLDEKYPETKDQLLAKAAKNQPGVALDPSKVHKDIRG